METTGTETPNCRTFHKRERKKETEVADRKERKKRIESGERGETFSDQKSRGAVKGVLDKKDKEYKETKEVFTPQTKTQIKGIESFMHSL